MKLELLILLRQLLSLVMDRPDQLIRNDVGICENIELLWYEYNNEFDLYPMGDLIQELMITWPKVSNSLTYPIIDLEDSFTVPRSQFLHRNNWIGNQFKLRVELIEWMIQSLEQELGE